jgi:hypothetical protein
MNMLPRYDRGCAQIRYLMRVQPRPTRLAGLVNFGLTFGKHNVTSEMKGRMPQIARSQSSHVKKR